MLNIYRFLAVTFLSIHLSLLHTNGQRVCAPLGVVNLTISKDAVISWEPNPNESCDISYYLLYADNDVGKEYVYAVSRTSLDVNFLPVCDNYVFKVVAVSTENVEGEEVSLATKIPLPADADLKVNSLKVTQDEGQQVHLNWTMDDGWIKCADRFRVIVNDQQAYHIQDIYTFDTSVTITNLAPCTSYEFGVATIYNWEIEGPAALTVHVTPEGVMEPPRLIDLSVQSTSANLTWSIEGYAFNKCPILEARVNVTDNYEFSVDILDQRNRPPFEVVLPNLRPQSIYRVNVTLINAVGPSRPVIVAIQTP